MNFYERYAKLCESSGIDPVSQKIADTLGITKATISSWNTKGTSPKGETVRVIADALKTTTDYLLGRTDDPSERKNISAADTPRMDRDTENLLHQISRLDSLDKAKAEAYLAGLLSHEKYQQQGKMRA